MKKQFLTAAAMLGFAVAAVGQQSPQQPGQTQSGQAQSAQPQGPRAKSQKELDALKQVQAATDPEQRITAIQNVLENFADTEYKQVLLDMAVQSAEQANDYPKIMIYGERATQGNPNDYEALTAMAAGTAQNTKEFDLDKEQKLAKVDKYAQQAIAAMKSASKPSGQLTDEQWEQEKKQLTAEAYASMGAAAMLRKKYDDAITNFKTAADTNPDAVILVRLADAYNNANQPDNAITTADRVIAMNDAPANLKQFAQAEKAKAQKAKGGK
ncbi:MAG TPA: tetratricopeptide repeat protein [Bryobacteraceae bacterium]|jgi:tetratricopeptide (TPR) repeat protein|nr:tetratricopeptide repeat protein [Bryobacteraceae bacterium]